MKSRTQRPQTYLWAAIVVSFLSLGLYYGVNLSSSYTSEPADFAVGAVGAEPSPQTFNTGFGGFLSFENPLAWFMFGAWFALLLFFVLSLMGERRNSK